ncbi:hypothetical protein V2G26_013817 [Clonostachys chloroleuca]
MLAIGGGGGAWATNMLLTGTGGMNDNPESLRITMDRWRSGAELKKSTYSQKKGLEQTTGVPPRSGRLGAMRCSRRNMVAGSSSPGMHQLVAAQSTARNDRAETNRWCLAELYAVRR